MKISLATNFDDELINKIKSFKVYEVYGRLNHDVLSGGRPNNSVNSLTKQRFEQHVKKVRAAGINFNYLINGACSENKEQDSKWKADFCAFVNYLKGIGVNAFTVTNPLILILLKKIYPEAICRVSTFACVDSLEKAKYWQNLGADIICVDFVSVNRNFKMLKLMCKELTSKIEVLATNSCIKCCPYIHTHVNSIAHASSCKDNLKYVDWCLFKCQHHQLQNPEEYIKSPWIRPEDVIEYEKIGIEHFKLTERDFPTEILVKRLIAYTKREYEGNLLDLIQGHGYVLSGTQTQTLVKAQKLTSKEEIMQEIYRVRGFKRERKFQSHCYINNRQLDGFIKFFTDGNCKENCNSCNYCKNIANTAINVNKEITDYLIELYSKLEKLLMA